MEINTNQEAVEFSINESRRLFEEQADFVRQLQVADNEGMYDKRPDVKPVEMSVGADKVLK